MNKMDLENISRLQDAAQGLSNFVDGTLEIIFFMAILFFGIYMIFSIKAYKEGEIGANLFFARITAFLVFIFGTMLLKAMLDPGGSSSTMFGKSRFDFNYSEFKDYLAIYWGYSKVFILFMTFYFIGRLLYLHRLSKSIYKMFKSYGSIIQKYFIKGKPIEDNRVKIYKIEPELTNPLDPELWNKNVAKYFTERML